MDGWASKWVCACAEMCAWACPFISVHGNDSDAHEKQLCQMRVKNTMGRFSNACLKYAR